MPILNLFFQYGSSVNAANKKTKETALSHAIIGSRLEIAKELIRQGATVIRSISLHRSNLYLAPMCKSDEQFEIILFHYATYRGKRWKHFLADGAKGTVLHHNLKYLKQIAPRAGSYTPPAGFGNTTAKSTSSPPPSPSP